jgi:hypothetical protein
MPANLNNPSMRGPAFASLAANSLVLLVLAAGPAHWFRRLPPSIIQEVGDRVVYTQVNLPRHTEAPSSTARKADAAQARPVKQIAGPSASVTPGTERWRALVEEGEKHDLEITALGTMPLLQARQVELAFDTHMPSGKTYLLDPRTHALIYAAMPQGVVIRELELEPSDFEAERNLIEKYLGSPPRAFALYPVELYDGLKGLTLEALKKSGAQVDKVTTVTVQVQMTNLGNFTVTILG